MSHRSTRREFLSQSAAGVLGASFLGCESRLHRAAEAPPARQPNIVFIFDDQLRACDLGYNGGPNVPTPRLDRLAAEGVVFGHALSPCPVCTPYRGMLMTGRWPTHTGLVLNWVDSNPREYCLAEAFHDAGYDTGFIGKWHLAAGELKCNGKFQMTPQQQAYARASQRAYSALHPESEFVPPGPQRQGFDFWAAYNFHARFADAFYYRDTPERLTMPRFETDSEMDMAMDFMKARERSDRPFLLVIAPHPPHPPWNPSVVPAADMAQVRAELARRPNVPPDAAPARGNPRAYYGMIANFDAALGRLVDYLDQSGLGENTLLVVTADHGEMMGSHGRYSKMVPYTEAVGIPLIFRCPARLSPGKRDELYTPMDHMPTLCSFAGVPVPSTAEGVDLAQAVRGQAAPRRDSVLMMNYTSHWDYFDTGTQWPEWRAVQTGTHTYVKWLDGREELYDNVADPYQMNNLVKGQKDLPRLEQLRRRLRDHLAEADDEFLPGTAYADWYDDERNLIRTALGKV